MQCWSLPLEWSLIKASAPIFPINISLKWKQLAVANALAYHSKEIIKPVKIFIGQAPEANVIKLFTAVSYNFSIIS